MNIRIIEDSNRSKHLSNRPRRNSNWAHLHSNLISNLLSRIKNCILSFAIAMRCLGADMLPTSQQKQSNGNGPKCSRRLRLQEFLDNRHMNVVRLSALWTGRLHPQEKSLPWHSFMLKAELSPQP